MDIQSIVLQMRSNAQAIGMLVEGCSEQQARWKPDAAAWSVLEVVNHLLDEEREDFRPRIDGVLHRSGEAWAGIDPEGWVTARGYNQREMEPSVQGFLEAREDSLEWLLGLGEEDWAKEYQATFGKICAGDLLASWVVHDVLHMRQLVELKHAYLVRAVEPYAVKYAGDW
jgi:hypothetical protein